MMRWNLPSRQCTFPGRTNWVPRSWAVPAPRRLLDPWSEPKKRKVECQAAMLPLPAHYHTWFIGALCGLLPVRREAQRFAVVINLSLLVDFSTCIPDRPGDRAHTLDITFTSECSYSFPCWLFGSVLSHPSPTLPVTTLNLLRVTFSCHDWANLCNFRDFVASLPSESWLFDFWCLHICL